MIIASFYTIHVFCVIGEIVLGLQYFLADDFTIYDRTKFEGAMHISKSGLDTAISYYPQLHLVYRYAPILILNAIHCDKKKLETSMDRLAQ